MCVFVCLACDVKMHLRPASKAGRCFYGRKDLDRTKSLSKGDEKKSQHAARQVYEKGSMRLGITYTNMNTGEYIIISIFSGDAAPEPSSTYLCD